MEIFINNRYEEILKIIELKSIYQKVLLIHDNSISNFEINLIYNKIKSICIFNKMEFENIDKDEFYNGYKVIIFLCTGESLINFNLNKTDFINIYCPTNNTILPFLCNNYELLNKNSYLLLENIPNDLNLITSFCFNKFYNYLINILNNNKNEIEFNITEIHTTYNILQNLNSFKHNFYFIDLEIIAKYNIEYENLWLIDLILINALIVLINSIRNDKLMYIDIYKVVKDDYNLIDKFYTLSQDKTFNNILALNYNNLINFAYTVKEIILSANKSTATSFHNLKTITNNIKNYCKNCNNILSNLFLYNIFNI